MSKHGFGNLRYAQVARTLVAIGILAQVAAAWKIGPVWATEQASRVTTVFDFVAAFDRAEVANSLDARVDMGAKSGRIVRPSVYLHPTGQGDAVVRFWVWLPGIRDDERLLLVFYMGLGDGAVLNDPQWPVNGVRYAIELNGRRVFEESWMRCAWSGRAIDLGGFAGRAAQISLITNCNGEGNTDFDWALFGEPRILKMAGNLFSKAGPVPWADVGLGLLTFTYRARESGQIGIISEKGDAGNAVFAIPQAHVGDGQWHSAFVELNLATPEAIAAGQRFVCTGAEVKDVGVYAYVPELDIISVHLVTPVVEVGEPLKLRAVVRNVGRLALKSGEARACLRSDLVAAAQAERALPALAPGEEREIVWDVRGPNSAGRCESEVGLAGTRLEAHQDGWHARAVRSIAVVEPIRLLTQTVSKEPKAYSIGNCIVLDTPHLRIVLVWEPEGIAGGLAFAAIGQVYRAAGAIGPLGKVIIRAADGTAHQVRFKPVYRSLEAGRIELEAEGAAPGGAKIRWRASLRPREGMPLVHVECSVAADQDIELLKFEGPTVYAGERAFGTRKAAALFPGLEYLEGGELSSSKRDAAPPINLRLVPHPFKVTLPLMAVSSPSGEGADGKHILLAMLWDQMQRWDGERFTVCAKFASPNWHEDQDNHLMGLFLPTIPDYIQENQETAKVPYPLQKGKQISLAAALVIDGAAKDVLDAIDYWYAVYGVPEPLTPPRPQREEIELCRYGFLHTVWDAATGKSSHCIGWNPVNSPGFATLLWADYLATGSAEAKERALLVGSNCVREGGDAALASTANCHIMRWEFPFYYGGLAGALEAAGGMVSGIIRGQGPDGSLPCLFPPLAAPIVPWLIRGQEPDGSWRFNPDEYHKSLGKPGDAVVGTCAHNAWMLLKYARITGDEEARAAGLKGLAFMDRFVVPRGAQPWECPLYEPDILAAAHAVAAYTEGYRLTAEPELLERAIYWARAGLPFLFAWNHQDRPGQRYASIPVFGTSFFTHSWLGVPVQWKGLVYAYALQHLADALGPADAQPVWRRADFWRRIAEGITVSAEYQQFADGDLKGTYPDGFYGFCTERAAPYINPEDIMVNRLALTGRDPDVSTAIVVSQGRRMHISSGARVERVSFNGGLQFSLRYKQGEASHSLVTGLARPVSVQADGRPLDEAVNLRQAAQGWQYDAARKWLLLKISHTVDRMTVRIR